MLPYALTNWRRFGLAITLAAVSCSAGSAQSILKALIRPDETTPVASASAEPLSKKRENNSERLRLAQLKLDADPSDPVAAEEVTLFRTVETVHAQQEAVDQQIQDLESRQRELKQELQSLAAAAGTAGGAFPFIEFDRLVNQLAAEKARTELIAARLKSARAALEQAQVALDKREQESRQAQEAADLGKGGADAVVLATAAEQARLASALAAETVALRQKEVSREKLSQEVHRATAELLENRVTRNRPLVVFAESDLQEQLTKLAHQEEKLRAALKNAEQALPAVQSRWSGAKRRHDAASGDRTLLTEELEAWRRERQKLQEENNTYLVQLLQLEQLRTAWNRLYQLMSTTPRPSAEELLAWEQDTSAALKDLIGSTQGHLFRIDELRNELAAIAAKAESAKDGPADLLRWIEKQRGHLEEMIRIHEANLVFIDTSRRLHGKLRTEIGRDTKLISPEKWALHGWQQLADLWNYEIYAADVNGSPRSITVDKIVKVIVLFIVGLIVSRVLSTFVSHRLLRRFRLSKDATAIIRTLTFYTLLVIVALWALQAVHVPLTAFTILGGALAIGVGFGSQALISNFISGLIIMAERPVRIGERIVFKEYDGMVEEIGFRSMKLRTLTDHLVTIPNSSLVNDTIENIGRRRTLRRILHVTITYDTPREKITEAVEAIREILEESGIREPIHPVIGWDKFPPRVFFNDFNAESLNIQVVYWYAPPDHWEYMEHCQKVNLRIIEEFERLGVDFAFPSRTLYLAGDSKRELAVRLSPNVAQGAA